MNEQIKIFAGSSGKNFAEKMCSFLHTTLGESQVFRFSEGNIFVRINETVRQNDVFLVQSIGLTPNDDFTEILFWLDAFKRASAHSVTAVIPYFGYAKGDKKDEPRVSIRAKVCAECIELAGADRVVTLDLHSPQIQGFFKSPVDNFFAMPLFVEYVRSMKLDNLVIASPDIGGAKRARWMANALECAVAIGDKIRRGHDEKAEVLELMGDVENNNVVIIDDCTISGGTLIDFAKLLNQRGAKRIIACLSHNTLNEAGAKRLEACGIEQVVSTDSVYNPHISGAKFKTLSAAPLLAEGVRRIHRGDSVSVLFDKIPDEVFQAAKI